MSEFRIAAAASLLAALYTCACTSAFAQATLEAARPEAASGVRTVPGWATSRFAVTSANPLATEAGYRIIKAGGSAIDAAVAVQMVLALVEPQASGIGGGALLLHFNGRDVEAFDGRETAPREASGKLFLDAQGKPMSFNAAVVGGRAVGVPGAVRMLEMAHREYGKLPWAVLFEPAIALATRGFAISPRLASQIADDRSLNDDPVTAAYFLDAAGKPKTAGTVLRNPELAEVLRRLAAEGSRALHEGLVARAIVEKVRFHKMNPGFMSAGDLAGYQAKKRVPICHDWRAANHDYRVCGFPPPSSGAIAIGQILGMLSATNAAALPRERGVPGADWLHAYVEASKLAFADRALYVADPDFVAPPAGGWQSLLEPGYLASRAALIGPTSTSDPAAGSPGGVRTSMAPMPEQAEYGTSHINIVDAFGNALSMTTTVEQQFGSRQMVNATGREGGFLLNNELTDFSFAPTDSERRLIANRVEPGKRPRSSMAPMLVFDKATGRLVMAAGSAGGSFIIHFMAKTMEAALGQGIDVQRSIDLPNVGTFGEVTLLEAGRFSSSTIQALRTRGAPVREIEMTSGTQAIVKTPQGFFSGADPRREGTAKGD